LNTYTQLILRKPICIGIEARNSQIFVIYFYINIIILGVKIAGVTRVLQRTLLWFNCTLNCVFDLFLVPFIYFLNANVANIIMQSRLWTLTDFLKICIMHNCILQMISQNKRSNQIKSINSTYKTISLIIPKTINKHHCTYEYILTFNTKTCFIGLSLWLSLEYNFVFTSWIYFLSSINPLRPHFVWRSKPILT